MEIRQLYNGNSNPGTVSVEYLIPNHMTVKIEYLLIYIMNFEKMIYLTNELLIIIELYIENIVEFKKGLIIGNLFKFHFKIFLFFF